MCLQIHPDGVILPVILQVEARLVKASGGHGDKMALPINSPVCTSPNISFEEAKTFLLKQMQFYY